MAGISRLAEECRKIDIERMVDHALRNTKEAPLD
jgi:hypothetical protein